LGLQTAAIKHCGAEWAIQRSFGIFKMILTFSSRRVMAHDLRLQQSHCRKEVKK
jgi:hypothetical protein